MDEKEAYASPIAAEAVGETLGSPPPASGEQSIPMATSAGAQAGVADKTAESVGERTGSAYADATTDQARERSQKAVQRGAARGGFRTGRELDSNLFRRPMFTAIAGFALGYIAAVLSYRGS